MTPLIVGLIVHCNVAIASLDEDTELYTQFTGRIIEVRQEKLLIDFSGFNEKSNFKPPKLIMLINDIDCVN